MKKNFRRITAVLLIIILLLSAISVGSFITNAAVIDDEIVSSQRDTIVSVAQNEVGVSGRPNKYTYWLGKISGSYSYPWCATFVSWCAEQAGVGDLIPKTASCTNGMNWFKNNGLWKNSKAYGGDYTPRAGDIVYYSDNYNQNDSSHVGIIVGTNGDYLSVIEGNSSDAVQHHTTNSKRMQTNRYVLGYGTPAYNDEPEIHHWYDDYSPVDLGTGFYASIIYAPKWKSISANYDNNVILNSEPSPISAEFVWRFERQGDGSYKILNMANKKCLDVLGMVNTSGANVQVCEDNGGDNQRWYIYGTTNSFQLRAKHTDCVLDLTGNDSDNGTNIQIHEKNDSDAQKFAIYKHDFDFNVADIGTNVYAFIVNSPMWKTISVAQNQNVELRAERSSACPYQIWKFEKQWDGSYKITSHANGYCLDVWGNSSSIEANVVVDKDNGGNNQRWYIFQKDGYYTLRAKNTQCVLDVKDNSNTDGTNIQMFSENGSDAQKFAIYQIDKNFPVTYPIENLGDDFYAPLLKFSPWKTLWNNGEGNLELQSEKSNSKFLWRFKRNIDGAYTIYSAYDGKCLDLAGGSHDAGTNVQLADYNGSDSQRWYIYNSDGRYYIQSKESGNYLDVTGNNNDNGTNIEVWIWNGSEAQRFAIYMGDECKLHYSEMISVQQNGKSTEFNWSSVYGETNNVIKIWKNSINENEPCYLEKVYDSEITSCGIELPEGNYEAVVEVNNHFETKSSNSIKFYVAKSYEIGDTNLDGRITISDVTAIQRHLAELDIFSEDQIALADTNGDGEINISDATHLQKYLAEFDGIVLGKQPTA